MSTLKSDEIKVGKRYRKQVGDVTDLVESIKAVGLLHPVVVTKDGQLVAGLRRLAACNMLEIEDIPVRVVDTDKLLLAQHDENELREDFTVAERTEIGKQIEIVEARAARERQSAMGGKQPGSASGKLPEAARGEAKQKAANAVGMSKHTYEKAKAVVEAAQAEPEKFSDLQDQMDETGKVSPAHAELERRKAEKEHVAGALTAARAAGDEFVEEASAVKEIVRACQGVGTRVKNLKKQYGGLGEKSAQALRDAFEGLLNLLK